MQLPAFLDSFRPRRQPLMTRPTYAAELIMSLTTPIGISMIEASVIGVVAKKVFGVSPMIFGVVTAAPLFAMLTSTAWAHLARGKSKVRYIVVLQVAAIISIAAMALLPISQLGQILLAVNMVISRCLIAGTITLRSVVWRHNYPRHVRGQITGKLSIVSALILAGAPLLASSLLDSDPRYFRFVYAGSAAISLIGAWAFAKIRLRHERELLRFELRENAQPQPHGRPDGIYEYDEKSANGSFWSVLKRDALFREYQVWQFVFGAANLMSEAVIVFFIADITRGKAEFLVSIVLSQVVPQVLATATVPLWARWFDNSHIATFRACQSPIWVCDGVFKWLAAFLVAIPPVALTCLVISRLLQGVARGGGLLAWNLGHNDFSDRRMVAHYMGVHVTLTGLRGAICPLLAMALYAGIGAKVVKGEIIEFGFGAMREHVFLVSVVMSAIGGLGFYSLSRKVKRQGRGGYIHDDS